MFHVFSCTDAYKPSQTYKVLSSHQIVIISDVHQAYVKQRRSV